MRNQWFMAIHPMLCFFFSKQNTACCMTMVTMLCPTFFAFFLQGQDYHTVIQLPFFEGLLCLLLIFLVSSDNVFFPI